YTIGDYLATSDLPRVGPDHPAFREAEAAVATRVTKLLSINGQRTVDSFHRELGRVMWEYCGMARSADGLKTALEKIPALREEYWRNVRVLSEDASINQSLEK
ncbi:MAG: fumarate reductase/succinate dehydrogenase flavoprotein subunit, partial [Acidobacteria bacterium]